MPRSLLALVAAAAALAFSAAPAAAFEPGVVQSANFGADEADVTASLGARWVRLFAIQSHGCPLPPHEARRLDAYHAKGINVLIAGIDMRDGKVTPPSDPASFARWAACLASTHGEKIDAIEVWNEPDERAFWPSGPNAGAYADLLRRTYDAVKAARPATTVLVGGLTGNNFEFLDKLYDHGAQGKFDAVGVHTDTACLVREPEFSYREPDGRIGRFAFTGYREVRHVMERRGDPKPIWMTEIGWSTLTSKCSHPGVTESRPSGVSADKQADFMQRAFACVAADPYVEKVLWFSLRDAGTGDRYDHHLGLQDVNGNAKPAFHAFRNLFANGGRPDANPNCGAKLDKDAPTITPRIPGRYVSRLMIEGSATDPTTAIQRIELWVDGKRVPGLNQERDTYKYDWFGSSKLSFGRHTIELRAYDEAQNMGRATVEVIRLNPRTAPRTASARVEVAAKRSGRRLAVGARVLRAMSGDFTEAPRGMVRIVVQRKAGKGWKTVSRYAKGVSRQARVGFTARRRGTYRIFTQLKVDAPYRNSRSKPVVVKL